MTFTITAFDGATAWIAQQDAPALAVEVACSALPADARYGDELELEPGEGWTLRAVPRNHAADAATLRRLAAAMVSAAASTLGIAPSEARAALLAAM
jgi:hypothetical protein